MQTEQTAQHTPGPWKHRADGIIDSPSKFIAHMDENTRRQWPQQAEANARLIAAAPDLLAALEYLTDLAAGPPGGVTIDQKRAAMDRARAAIAKAKGGAA